MKQPFNDSYAVREISDTDINPGAPKNGAGTKGLVKKVSDPISNTPPTHLSSVPPDARVPQSPNVIALEDVITRLKVELEPAIRLAAREAAGREHERTREWLEHKGLPKAAHVAQHEAFNLLRKYGLVGEASRSSRAQSDVSRSSYAPPAPRPLPEGEVSDLAQACAAILETQGHSIEVTLSEMSVEAGGFLLPEDAARVREKAHSMISTGDGRGRN